MKNLFLILACLQLSMSAAWAQNGKESLQSFKTFKEYPEITVRIPFDKLTDFFHLNLK